jgi:hypothetical protein
MAGLLAPQFQNEGAAREHLESLLWNDGPVCPKCGVIDEAGVTELQKLPGYKSHGRTGLHQCKGCRAQFTVTVGTIFEDSHIPIHKWLLAIHLMCSSKKGISALQIQRNLELGSYRTAWFMCHRIRWAMTQSPMVEKLSGAVEADETYVGGREVGQGHQGRNVSKKTPVLALVERGGDVRSFPIQRATLKNIKPTVEHVDPSTHLITDEYPVCYQMRNDFAAHSEIKHKDKKYVRKDGEFVVTTNTVESFFAILKRSNYGIHHHMSRKYLGSYCAEREFVYNCRKLNDDGRTEKAIKKTRGKRLMLKQPKNAG